MPEPTERIVFVRQGFNPHGGGELILGRIMAALVEEEAEVVLVARNWRDPPPGVEVIACDPPARGRARREAAFAAEACRLIGELGPAVVQAHEKIPCADIYRAGDGTHAAFLGAMGRVRPLPARLATAISGFHRNRLRLEAALFASPRLKAVIANSQMVADGIAERYGYPPERIHLVPNGIDLDRFHPRNRTRDRDEARAEIGTPPERPVLLFVGSGYERKGLATAIAALARLSRDCELWVVGHDRRPDAYRRLAARAGVADQVRLLGPRGDPAPLYAAADALILPALYDPFPSTVLEALASGLPVVTSPSCGASEVVGRLDPRLVVDALDPAANAAAAAHAIDLAGDDAARVQARTLAEAYGIEAMMTRLFAVYASVFAELGFD